jgi:hypothetical protein
MGKEPDAAEASAALYVSIGLFLPRLGESL